MRGTRAAFASTLIVAGLPVAQSTAVPVPSGCKLLQFSGEVVDSQRYERRIGSGLSFVMSPVDDGGGWNYELGPEAGAEGADYVYVLNPPYRFGNDLYQVSTEYGRRAQDATAKGVRSFWFRLRPSEDAAAEAAIDKVLWPGAKKGNDTQGLRELNQLSKSVGEFQIDDASFIAGSAPRRTGLQEGQDARELLGQISRLRFTVRLNVPAWFKPGAGLAARPARCPQTVWYRDGDFHPPEPAAATATYNLD